MQRFEEVVEVGAPLEHVFDLFSDFESFPRWMGGLRDVRRRGRRLTHWVAETALDIDVEWDAETTVFEPDRRVVWRSVGGDVRADGEAIFAETERGTTLVHVVLGYGTPGGRTGERVARFFGRHPGRQLVEDLERFRRLAERQAGGGRWRERERRDEGFGRGESAAERARRSDSQLRDAQRRQADGEEVRAYERRESSEYERRGVPREFERRETRGYEGRPPAFAREQEERGRRPRAEEFGPERPRHALTPREREREQRRQYEEREGEQERRRAGFFLRRGVDRLMDEPPRRDRRF
jgi:uncharacterized protein YndB with AHSA1/START domain